MGKDVGLQSGTLDADFDAQMERRLPGGSGPTSLKGTIKLAGLRFAGAEGGKKLDVTLESDVKGDATAGDLTIDKLRLDIGPAGNLRPRTAKGLNTPTPRIQGLEIVSTISIPSGSPRTTRLCASRSATRLGGSHRDHRCGRAARRRRRRSSSAWI